MTLLFTLIVAVIFILINKNPIAKGLILGTLFSIVNFFLLGKSIPMTLGRSRYKAGLIGLASILSRYILLAIPIIVGLKYDSYNFIAAVAGIFSIQIVTMMEYLVIRPIVDGK